LDDFRKQIFDIKEQVIKSMNCQLLFNEVIDNINVNNPEVTIKLPGVEHQILPQIAWVSADAALLPAIMNLVNNAITASKQHQSNQLSLSHLIADQQWHFSIRDYGKGFSINALNNLGVQPVNRIWFWYGCVFKPCKLRETRRKIGTYQSPNWWRISHLKFTTDISTVTPKFL
jgi:two-component system sensor histidine kinase RegB